MISNQEDDEFVAVRVQDPRMQNEGSWNSYVDYKIFLHTNSKAFTAKTSCVRRRYSEFAWLKKKLQKNAGLVPVPDLPGKSFFFFSNEDFLEKRRKGLQTFLDNVVNMTVCLSDSQLHLFLQTQLPVGHIEDCVQGHTPYSVMDAILTYASSNRGFAQAQEDDSIKEPSLTVSYESMESPAPHQPCLHPKESSIPELLSCGDPDPLEGLLELCEKETVELQHQEKSSVRVLQKNNHLEAVVEDQSPAGATFFVGDGEEEETQQRSCQIQTPVEVHSLMENGVKTLEDDLAKMEKVDIEAEEFVNSAALLDFKNGDFEEEGTESDGRYQEVVLEVVCSEEQVLENPVILQVNGLEHEDESDGQTEPEKENSDESEIREEETHRVLEVENIDIVQQEVEVVGTKDDKDSLSSSNESIVKVSDEESICDEPEDSTLAANGFVETPPEVDASSRNMLELHMNGCLLDEEDTKDLHYTSDISQPLDPSWTVTGGDLTENSDFSILECSCTPGLADGTCTEQEALSSLSLDASEETREVEVH